jgi:hypothetical protein
MPYRVCPDCGLRLYSAAAWSTRDACPRCDVPLEPRPAFVRDGGRATSDPVLGAGVSPRVEDSAGWSHREASP